MNIIGGLLIITVMVGFLFLVGPMVKDMVGTGDGVDRSMGLGLGLLFGAFLLLLAALALGLIFGLFSTSPTYQVGACYKAYEHNSYIPIYNGKTTTIIPTTSVDLVQILCP